MYRRISSLTGVKSFELHSALYVAGLPQENRTCKRRWTRRNWFFFTEEGWRKFGHKTLAALRAAGHQVRVMALKEKDPTLQILYKDRWQVMATINGASRQRKGG